MSSRPFPWLYVFDDILPNRREVLSRDADGSVSGVAFRESESMRQARVKAAAEYYERIGWIWPFDGRKFDE